MAPIFGRHGDAVGALNVALQVSRVALDVLPLRLRPLLLVEPVVGPVTQQRDLDCKQSTWTGVLG